MAFLEPCLACKLVERFKNSLRTYAMCSMRVCKVTGEVDLVWLYFLKQFNYYIDISLCAFSLLDASCLVERQVEEMAVGLVVQSE